MRASANRQLEEGTFSAYRRVDRMKTTFRCGIPTREIATAFARIMPIPQAEIDRFEAEIEGGGKRKEKKNGKDEPADAEK
jgi:hypothetical protein